MNIIIAGGGIAGLTSALAARKSGYNPIIYEKAPRLDMPSFGGGIGLWPPSQAVMKNLGLLETIKQVSLPMPSAAYYNKDGEILGKPTNNFGSKFPVICLQRKQLCQILLKACQKQEIQIYSHTSIDSFIENKQSVIANISDGTSVSGSLLIGADGINSQIRSQILKQRGMLPIQPHHCGYAYFRAVVDISQFPQSQWHQHSFESWGDKKRLGFVPLKYPYVFWFVAIPIGESGLQEYQGSHTCDEERKSWILAQFSSWKGPVKIKKLLQMTPAQIILRTDIRKIQGVTKFPWLSKEKKAILLGDSANATAPNLAQGAGLAIQSAWDLFSLVDLKNSKGFEEYVEKRKKRAYTVQSMADMVAKVGQLSSPYSTLRDITMSSATRFFPGIQNKIFQFAVKHSLGGSSSSISWRPPHQTPVESLFEKIIGPNKYAELPLKTQKFRKLPIGDGEGEVTVEAHPLGKLIGLPANMQKQPFTASIQTLLSKEVEITQKWTRVFGDGTNVANKFSTFHHSSVDFDSKTGYALTETLGFGPDIIRFGYNPIIKGENIVYQSNGLWLKNYYLPIPSFLCPKSSWVETQTKEGWEFSGEINFPKIMGGAKIMKYYGNFKCNDYEPFLRKKTVVVTGGSGMIGKEVCKAFFKDGWKVIILTRDKKTTSLRFPYCSVYEWGIGQNAVYLAQIIEDADAIVNLAGQNPGGGLWTNNKKGKILESRKGSINALAKALELCRNKNKIFIQSSAAGIYGNRGEQILRDNSFAGQETNFRVQSCKTLENETRRLIPGATIARIGHVLSSEGGLFPFIKLGSFFGVAKLGAKKCYIPWVHIEDVASAFLYVANDESKSFSCKQINVTSPNNATYEELFEQLGKLRGRKGGYFTIPQFLLKTVMGEISSVILESQRMVPQSLLQKGFTFKYAELKKAITSQNCL